jgi:hypothetical protein
MEGMEEKLSAILSNPDMMNTIMPMAKTLGQNQPPTESTPQQKQELPQQKPSSPPSKGLPLGRNELEMISRISALSRQTGLDRQEQTLLKALHPYLSRDRLSKLEKAMHAAKMARFATFALEQGGNPVKTGR